MGTMNAPIQRVIQGTPSGNPPQTEAIPIDLPSVENNTKENAMPTGTQEYTGNHPSTGSAVHQENAKPIEINAKKRVYAVAFLGDGELILSRGEEPEIQRWQADDGTQAIGITWDDADAPFGNIAVSQDGRWISSGMEGGKAIVWDATTFEKTREFKGHEKTIYAIDFSPDGTRLVTGSDDYTACVWEFSTGERLLGPLQHSEHELAAVKFSKDGCLLATATWERDSVRAYDSQDGRLLVDFPLRVNSALNQSLVWANDSKHLFALSLDGHIHHLDVSTGTALSRWLIHTKENPSCIALASDGTFLVASASSSFSCWDAESHQQIGPVIDHADAIDGMAISTCYDIVTAAGKKITVRNLCDILPPVYSAGMLCKRKEQKAFFEALKRTRVFCELDIEWCLDSRWEGTPLSRGTGFIALAKAFY